MTIREILKLGPEDWAAFRSIRLESLERAPHVFGTGLHQEVEQPESWWRDRLGSIDVGIHAARLGNDVVGIAGWMLPPAANVRHRAYLWGVYVRDGLRGAGTGRALVTAAIAEASTLSEAIDLQVLADNASAIRLYQSLGFVVVGTVPRALKHAGVYRDQHLMARDPAAVGSDPQPCRPGT